MKKTFKGYSALIALLIALLVVTAMPVVSFAAEPDHSEGVPVAWKNGDGVVETHYYDPSEWEILEEATCQKDGIIRYACLEPQKHGVAEAWHEIIVPANEIFHDLGSAVVQGTCEEGGKAVYTCSICGETVERAIPANGHQYGTAEGITTTKKNNKEYAVLPAGYGTDKAVTAEYDAKWAKEGVTVTVPDCRNEGKVTYACKVCGKTKSTPIEKDITAHRWDGAIYDPKDPNCVKPTCAAPGKNVHYCYVCGTKSYVDVPKLEAKWVVTEEIFDGCYTLYTYRYCAHCEENKADAASVVHPIKKDATTYSASAEIVKEYPIGAHEFTLSDYDVWTKNLIDRTASSNWFYDVEYDSRGRMIPDTFKFTTANCAEDGKIVILCDHFKEDELHDTKGEDDKKAARKTVTLKAPGHQWGDWVERYAIGAGDNEYAYYIRQCEVCGLTDELISKHDPRDPESGDVKPVNPNKFAVDVTAVKDGSGTVTVTRTEGDADIEVTKLFARVTWVYELSDGSTFAYAAQVPVEMDGQKMVAKVGKVSTPAGATLVETQIALTDTKDAHMAGEYNQLAGAKA